MTALAEAPAPTLTEEVFASLTADRARAHPFDAHGEAAIARAAHDDRGAWPSTTARRTALGPDPAESRFPSRAPSTPSPPPTAPKPAGSPAPALRPRVPAAPGAQGHPRARLLPAPPAATAPRIQGPPLAVPPTLGERVRVLRAGDRSFVTEADEEEDRGAPPATHPGLVARRLAIASVEVLTGLRPAAQLARWLAPGVLDALRVRSTLGRRGPRGTCRAAACRGVRVVRVDRHAVEATAVVDDGRRVRAVAIRLETHRGTWRATALEVG